ncbi:MAG: U32 family peptidase [Candidatus Omnitrophica bacterium]|nr:U32 family peptidase [Candidatus Omnitrophota bacterium]
MRKKIQSIKPKRVELSAPAGNWCCLRTAVTAGADSVYFGVKGLNMRQGADNFDILELNKVMDFLRSKDKKGYLALNTIIFDREMEKAEKILIQAKKCGVHAVICWDMSLIPIANNIGLDIHLSTQAGIANKNALRYYALAGAKRVVLARECGLDSIRESADFMEKEKIPCQIEVFIHGAMCVSVSGRCFLSDEAFKKSANRGQCLQPCRRMFFIQDIDNESSYRIGPDYLLSPKDLCVMPFFEKMMESGADVFKIEGRNRSPEYVKETTLCYREAMEAYYGHRLDDGLKETLLKRLNSTYNRGLDAGFYLGKPRGLNNGPRKSSEKIYAGRVMRFFPKISVADVLIEKGPLIIGDRILISGKHTPAEYCLIEEMQSEKKPLHTALTGLRVGIKVPFKAHKNDKVFSIKSL